MPRGPKFQRFIPLHNDGDTIIDTLTIGLNGVTGTRAEHHELKVVVTSQNSEIKS